MTENSDKLFYTSVEVLNNGMVYERYINKEGKEMIQTSMFRPSLFVKTQEPTDYKDIYGNYCAKHLMDDIPYARKWIREKKLRESDYLGMDNFQLQYITDNYKNDIEYDMDYIRTAFYDIEVTTNDGSFPEPEYALYPVDLITLKDSIDDKIYVLDLLKDDGQGIIEVERWTPEMDIIDEETFNKVEYVTFESEKDLLVYFLNYIQVKMPSIMFGWNSDKFDLVYLRNRILRVFGEECTNLLSPCNEVYERKTYDEVKGQYNVTYTVKGVAMMDFMEIFKAFSFKPMSSYSLDNVSNEELGKGKVNYLGPIHTLRRGNYLPTYEPDYEENDKLSKWLWIKYKITYYEENKKFNIKAVDVLNKLIDERNEDHIIKLFKTMDNFIVDIDVEDHEVVKDLKNRIYAVYSAVSHSRFVTYGIYDTQNLVEIDEKNNFSQLVYDLSFLAKIPVSRVMSKIGLWDGIVFSYLKSKKMVVPKMEDNDDVEKIVGAYVKEVVAGARNYVASFDLTSLYPKIMSQCNISPEKLAYQFDAYSQKEYINATAPRPSDEYSCCPNGWGYKKDGQGILPFLVDKIYDERKFYQTEMHIAERNREIILKAKHEKRTNEFSDINELIKDLNYAIEWRDHKEIVEAVYRMNDTGLLLMEALVNKTISAKNTAQINRKILINSAYGAMANQYFRYMDTRNASAITGFGQLVIQWVELRTNNFLNEMFGTKDVEYVFYIDTDSIYVHLEELVVREMKVRDFVDTNEVVDFIDEFSENVLKPKFKLWFEDLCVYMNNMESKMNMDREVISMSELGSEGFGAFWTAKKRYALNMYDKEGVRYDTPKLKIMGIETQRSSTPKYVQTILKEGIRIILQEGEKKLQSYVSDRREHFLTYKLDKYDYRDIAKVSSANNITKYSYDDLTPKSKTPSHIKGVLSFLRLARDRNLPYSLQEGNKIMVLRLIENNPYDEKAFSWESMEHIPYEMRDVLQFIDYGEFINKDLIAPLAKITDAIGISYEKTNITLSNFFTTGKV